MGVERSFLCEALETDIAAIGFLSGMHSHVHSQIVLHCKSLRTPCALKWPLSGMRPDVVLEAVYYQSRVRRETACNVSETETVRQSDSVRQRQSDKSTEQLPRKESSLVHRVDGHFGR